MEFNQFLIVAISMIITLFTVVDAQDLKKEYPAVMSPSLHQAIKSRSKINGAAPADPSQFSREKKWSLYMIPDPPYARGPYPVPAPTYSHYPYTHPRYVLERNSYPSDDFQFFYY